MRIKAKHTVSEELRAAVREYYEAQGQPITGMKLIEFTYHHSVLDVVLVHFIDKSDGTKTATLCYYDGHEGVLWHPDKPRITEGEWYYPENAQDEKKWIDGFCQEEETEG